MYPRGMETETPEPDTPTGKTLSTKVDDDLYDWFLDQATDNDRNVAGHLRWLLKQHRRLVEATELPMAFTSAVRRELGVPGPPWPHDIKPYDQPTPEIPIEAWSPAAPAEPFDDDPEEGVR